MHSVEHANPQFKCRASIFLPWSFGLLSEIFCMAASDCIAAVDLNAA